MEEKRERFYATFFDKDTVLKLSRWAGIFAWVALIVYLFTTGLNFFQFMQQFATGVFYQKGMSIVDLVSFFNPYLLQSLPGVVYFFGLKFVENTLLILMDIEESTRRSARNGK
jgi:hypothetical protein